MTITDKLLKLIGLVPGFAGKPNYQLSEGMHRHEMKNLKARADYDIAPDKSEENHQAANYVALQWG